MIPYCGRPVGFEELIFKNLKQNLKQDDLLIHLGDFCIGNDSMWHTRFNDEIRCTKWFIRGNHDQKSSHWYMAHGWNFVGTTCSDTLFGKRILFSHIPVAQNDSWDINIHGHFHNSDHRSQEPELLAIKSPKHRLLALEYTNYQPVLLDKFLNTNAKKEI